MRRVITKDDFSSRVVGWLLGMFPSCPSSSVSSVCASHSADTFTENCYLRIWVTDYNPLNLQEASQPILLTWFSAQRSLRVMLLTWSVKENSGVSFEMWRRRNALIAADTLLDNNCPLTAKGVSGRGRSSLSELSDAVCPRHSKHYSWRCFLPVEWKGHWTGHESMGYSVTQSWLDLW